MTALTAIAGDWTQSPRRFIPVLCMIGFSRMESNKRIIKWEKKSTSRKEWAGPDNPNDHPVASWSRSCLWSPHFVPSVVWFIWLWWLYQVSGPPTKQPGRGGNHKEECFFQGKHKKKMSPKWLPCFLNRLFHAWSSSSFHYCMDDEIASDKHSRKEWSGSTLPR